jgi:hypothetical protein
VTFVFPRKKVFTVTLTEALCPVANASRPRAPPMLGCHASQLCAAVRRVQVPCFHGGEGEIWSARFPATAHVALLGGREMSDPPNRVHDLTDGTSHAGARNVPVFHQRLAIHSTDTVRTTVATTARSDQDDCFSASLLQYRNSASNTRRTEAHSTAACH